MGGAKASLVLILLYTFCVLLLADHEQPVTDKTPSQIEKHIEDQLHSHNNDTNAEKPVDPTTLEDDPVTEEAVEEDPYWHKREQDAEKVMVETFLTDTENDTSSDEFDHDPSNNNTRRQLGGKKYRGPCRAYNAIDMCWRCQPNWERNRKHLADCPLGFGRRTTGGKAGRFYVVTDPSDDSITDPKPGTLRHAVIQKKPLWIIFATNMIIKLQQELIMQGDKTIDGRGANVHIADGAGITIQFVRNVIIHNLHFHNIVATSGGIVRDSVDHMGFRTAADGDAISIFGSSDVWIDHVSGSNAADGLIDVVAGSTGITISNCHFVDHDKVLLFGAEDSNPRDRIMHVTIAYTHFGKRLIQRMPRCRWGFFHMVNNDYTHWLMYAIGGSQGATIISQGNRFIAPPDPQAKEVTHRISGSPMEWRKWTWRSEGDLMMNGAFFVESGKKNWIKKMDRLDLIGPLPAIEVTNLTKFAGPLKCIRGLPC